MDVASVDVIWNGFAQSLKIAALAETHEVACAPHNYYSHLATFIAAQWCAAIPNVRLLEIDVDDVPWREELTTARPRRSRTASSSCPSGPGWGCDVREDVLLAPTRSRSRGTREVALRALARRVRAEAAGSPASAAHRDRLARRRRARPPPATSCSRSGAAPVTSWPPSRRRGPTSSSSASTSTRRWSSTRGRPTVRRTSPSSSSTSPSRRSQRHARVAFAIDVLHHVHDLPGLVRAVRDVLRPDGSWTVIEPNSRNPYIWLHQERMRRAGLDEHHFRPDAFERGGRALGAQGRLALDRVRDPRGGSLRPASRSPAWSRPSRAFPSSGGSVVYRVGSV